MSKVNKEQIAVTFRRVERWKPVILSPDVASRLAVWRAKAQAIADAAHRLGIRERDADYGNGPLALKIRNRLINLTK